MKNKIEKKLSPPFVNLTILAKECYYCENPNHVVYNCLVRLDFQQLTAK